MKGQIFEVQPDWCRKPLIVKTIEYPENYYSKEFWEYVLFYDPTELYNSIYQQLDPNQRIQTSIGMDIFQNPGKTHCACGCGNELTGGKRRWSSEFCSDKCYRIFSIIQGRTSSMYMPLMLYYGKHCAECRRTPDQIAIEDYDNEIEKRVLAVDHIYPVKHGGGGSWLSNFQLLCDSCHKVKTKKDFGWGKPDNQLSLKM